MTRGPGTPTPEDAADDAAEEVAATLAGAAAPHRNAGRCALVLALATLLWLPSSAMMLRGDVDPLTAGVRFVVALVLAALGVGAVGALVDRYRFGYAPPAAPEPTDTEAETG